MRYIAVFIWAMIARSRDIEEDSVDAEASASDE